MKNEITKAMFSQEIFENVEVKISNQRVCISQSDLMETHIIDIDRDKAVEMLTSIIKLIGEHEKEQHSID